MTKKNGIGDDQSARNFGQEKLYIANDSQTVSHLNKVLNARREGDVTVKHLTTAHLAKPLASGQAASPSDASKPNSSQSNDSSATKK